MYLETISKKRTNLPTVLKNKLMYILKDTIGIVVFILMLIKCMMFMNILDNSGAAKLSIALPHPLFGNHGLYFWFTLIIFSLSYLFSKKAHLIALLIINIIYSIILIGDLWYYRGFKDFLSLHLLGETQNLNNLSDSVSSMARPIDIVFLLDIVIIIIVTVLFWKKYNGIKRERGIFSILFFIPIIIVLSLHIYYDTYSSSHSGSRLFKTEFIAKSTMENLSPIGYHFFDTVLYLQDHMPYHLSENEKSGIQAWLDYKNEKLPPNEYKGLLKGKNLIIIQVESLENFVIGQSYNGQELTPNLNKLLKNSIYFNNFYEQVNNGTSSDSDLMINTSVFPVRRGSTFFRFPDNKYNTLATLLKDKDYYTRVLHADYGYYWNLMKAISNFGFDKCWDVNNFDTSDPKSVFALGLTDESFFKQVAKEIPKEKKPFFYFTVTTTTHGPFDLREDMKELKMPQNFDSTKMGGYFQAAHYVDKQIGSFINSLDNMGILDDTTVVIYGDHNGVHKYYNDEIENLKEKESWWDNNHKLPLIIYNKGLQEKVVSTAGGQIDVLPTLSYLLGVDEAKYENTSLGRNLLNTKKSYALLNDGNIIGEENLSQKDIDHIKKSFEISDLIIRTNYFNKDK